MIESDLFVSMNGQLLTTKDPEPLPVKIDLYWSTREPASITITTREPNDATNIWEVARDLFAQAVTCPGPFFGGGDFAICQWRPRHRFNLVFKPIYVPRDRWVSIMVDSAPILDFIPHTYRLIDAGAETDLIDRQINRALAEILGE